MSRFVFLVLSSFLFTACARDEPVQTVAFYKENTKERKAVMDRCKNDPGELQLTPNCLNAEEADVQLTNNYKGSHMDLRGAKDEVLNGLKAEKK